MFSISAIAIAARSGTSRTTHHHGHARKACNARRAPAPFAGQDLEETIAGRPDDDRLNDALRADRFRQLLQRCAIHVHARLKASRRERIERKLAGGFRDRCRLATGVEQCIQPSAQTSHLRHQPVSSARSQRPSISPASARYASAPFDLRSSPSTGTP
jgi:hypothetical protein